MDLINSTVSRRLKKVQNSHITTVELFHYRAGNSLLKRGGGVKEILENIIFDELFQTNRKAQGFS